MKRAVTAIVLVTLGFAPVLADARVFDQIVERPSRRIIRENVRDATVRNPQMISIRDVPLDRTYDGSEFGVKFQYPSTWQRQDLYQENPPLTLVTMFLSPEQRPAGIRQNVNLVIEDLPSEMSLAEYTAIGIRIEQDFFEHYALLGSDDILLAGVYRAHRIVFTASLDNGDMTFEQIWMIRGRQAYVWTFADSAEGFEEHLSTFEKMMDTLTVR